MASRLSRKRQGVPVALTIAGSDSGGGAGVQADLKTFSALGVYGCSAITAITAQNTCAVTAVHNVPANIIKSQLEAVLDDLDIGAIKIGMLSNAEIIEVVASVIKPLDLPIILDPVMVAKSGDRLLQDDAISALKEFLLPLATVLTPNLPEAADILGCQQAGSQEEISEQASATLELGPVHVLMKGGHADGDVCIDLLSSRSGLSLQLEAPRVLTQNTHGTGCTLSAAIAAGLAKGLAVPKAVQEAHAYLQGAINAADILQIGSGHGPVHHFHEVWK